MNKYIHAYTYTKETLDRETQEITVFTNVKHGRWEKMRLEIEMSFVNMDGIDL